ncbi:hypothetical protein ACJ41P_10720 [Azospirillum argentinense]|uniref:Uncharacterized protein n=1 Tax=Azospirillum argentinense TaxID=2970906 RepID=A0ABW8V520_9PROT
MITMKEAAAALDGNEYAKEGSKELFAQMNAAGLVAVFGASDDLMEFRGAENNEISAYEGATAYFNKYGMLENDCRNADCPHFEKLKAKASTVKAIWCPEGLETSWLIATSLPHERFKIMEDGDVYCAGLVFSLADCAA